MKRSVTIRVLYVDDDPLARALMLRSLDASLFAVDVASGGADALKMVPSGAYDIVMTDLEMPGMDGVELIRTLESHYPQLRYVVVTGQPEIGTKDVTSAVTSFVAKPWDRDEMTKVLLRTAALKAIGASRRAGFEGKLLMVEDDPMDVEIFKMHLRRVGWLDEDLAVANSLAEALELLCARSFDVIVSDLGLPDARGLDSVGRLRAACPHAALVLLTGNEDESVALQAVEMGAHEYLAKSDAGPQTIQRAIRYAQQRARSEQRLIYAASRDTLTGLCNRASVQDRAVAALARARRKGGELGVVFIDLNGFKRVNDTLGHAAGDAVLVHVGKQLAAAVRDGDTVARIGGDEFAVLVESVETAQTMDRVVARVRQALAVPVVIDGVAVRTEASFGVAMYPAAGECLDSLLHSADRAMYKDKFHDDGVRRRAKTTMSEVSQWAATEERGGVSVC